MTEYSTVKDRCAFVIGGSRGIGRAICERLAADGVRVAFSYNSRRDAANSLLDQLGAGALAVQLDLADVEAVIHAFDDVEGTFGGIDIVVVGGATTTLCPAIDVEPAQFDAEFAVNVRGTYFAMREAARRVRDNGRIIALSSAGTGLRVTDLSVYLGAKGAVEQFCRAFAHELGHRAITVNALSPGPTDTELLPDRDREVSPAMSPFGRLGTTQDIAAVAAFLAGPEAGWLTAQNIRATGGVV